MKTTVTWNQKMQFTATDEAGNTTPMDAQPEHGGEGHGPTPKQLVLEGLAGCTAMDVIAILNKMRSPPVALRVEASTEMTETHPKVFTAIHLRYVVKGDVPVDKLEKAIKMSQDTYCGVSAMLRKAAPITWEYAFE
ncbi:MAG: OsmC family protein [Deltaproteobacteria bacterium]|nr:OsmC family protein [Deltaproteobacteria bacterium]